jgi:Kef-type K+ transport system membrane component KefB
MIVKVLLSAGLVIATVRAFGWLLHRLHQPRVIGEIVAGIVLGPSVLGLVWPEAMRFLFPADVIDAFRVLAQFGLVLFMFLVGLELNLLSLRGEGRKTTAISVTSVVFPFVLGVAAAFLLYPEFGNGEGALAFHLFIGAAVSVTAFPVLARLLQEAGMFHTRIGAIAITCAAINDVLAWCLLAGVVAVAAATGPTSVAIPLALSLGFVLLMFKVVKPLLARWEPPGLWLVLVITFVSAWTTEQLHLHAIFGAFVAGAVMPRNEQWQRSIHLRLDATVSTFVLPIFFVVIGLATRVDGLGSWHLIGVLGLVTAVAVVGKLGGVTLAARAAGEPWAGAVTLGVLMNTRGLTELVILAVGLQLGVINTELFTIMVLMAVITTVVTAPFLRWLSRSDAVSAADPPAGAPAPRIPSQDLV